MKILVVGGAGYIGSHVVKELMKAGHSVTVFDNLSSGSLQNLFPENKFIAGDILHPETLDGAFSEGFDAFVHLAALKDVGESMLHPEKYSVKNITGTINLMNAAVTHGCKIMIFSSSATVFGTPEYLPLDEKHPKNPENYYGFTKLEIERFMEWYDKLKGLKYASLRYFNAAGYDEEGFPCGLESNSANLLPLIMEVAMGKRDKLNIFGDDYDTRDGTCIRDYVHVTDLAVAHVKAIEYISANQKSLCVNLGSEVGITVKEVLSAARRITGKEIPAEVVERRPGDTDCLCATSTYAKETLDWVPVHSDLDTLISSTWKAYQKANS